MKILIDNRMRKEEQEYLEQYGKVIVMPKYSNVYDEISSHPDIFTTQINGKIICSPCIYNFLLENEIKVIKGEKNPGKNYPKDILYNVCQIGEFIIGNFESCDSIVLSEIDRCGLKKINVKQGYSNCSISVLNKNACITSDEGIERALTKMGIDTCLIKSMNVKLLNSENEFSNMNGFIGGASCVFNNNFILFGDTNFLEKEEAERLKNFLEKYEFNLHDFKGKPIIDYGGVLFT